MSDVAESAPLELLPEYPELDPHDRRRIRADYERFGRDGLPADVEGYLGEAYRLDVAASYAGRPIRNPFGKASGQLSTTIGQVEADAEAGLGFVVLKTVIAQDEAGAQAMREWAAPETRMVVEPIAGRRVARLGWTVTWKGRGWFDTFAAYLDLFRTALVVGGRRGTVVAPSCKYHLPGPDEAGWREAEYAYTTRELHRVWREAGPDPAAPMPLEKDFSPTLAGSDRARQREGILEWVRIAPRLIKAQLPPGQLTLGLKLMNVVDDDDFQFEMLRAAVEAAAPGEGPDYLVYANRLFDPKREFLGQVGVAYGGPDLSARNLALLDRLRRAQLRGEIHGPVPEISATGDVHSGRMALEYALRGARSVQMHTLFQLPDAYYGLRRGTRSQQALHHLYFHPLTGLVPWLLHLRRQGLESADGLTRLSDLATWYRDEGRKAFLGG